MLLDGVWSFAASAPLVAGSLEEAGGADEDGVELSSDEEEGTVVEDAGSLVSAVVLSFEDSAVDSLYLVELELRAVVFVVELAGVLP